VADQPRSPLQKALDEQDAIALSQLASTDELVKLKNAEEVLELSHNRRRRTQRSAQFAQAMVGYVALAGFFANAYQSYSNKKDSEQRAQKESERWGKEFKRAQDADKYRAFFETSALATDPTNADKRLVGYALLKEFVDDTAYNSKAIIMLEESLALELRGSGGAQGLDDQRRLAVVAILSALSHTSDCDALGQAARTVDRLARVRRVEAPLGKAGARRPAVDPDAADMEDLAEVFEQYVRRLAGRAARSCAKVKDFREVRLPIRDALILLPPLGGKTGKLKPDAANLRIAELVRDGCGEDRDSGVATGCADDLRGYARLCVEMARQPGYADEKPACDLIAQAVAELGAAAPADH
jgi:hypothetical protein